MPFANQVTAGVQFVRQVMQSLGFVPGVSGWQLKRNGDAQFNDVTLTGTFSGANYIVDSSGEYWYSGTPAVGNLIASHSSTDTSDPLGNSVVNGLTFYTGNTPTSIFVSFRGNGVFFGTIQNADAGTGGMVFEPPITTRIVGRALATDPSTPGIDESWHSLAAGNGWTGTVYYRLTIDNEVELWSNNLTAPASSVNGVTIVTLPSEYWPLNVNMTFIVQQSVSGFGSRMTLSTTGTLQSTGVSASAGVSLGIRPPLDLP